MKIESLTKWLRGEIRRARLEEESEVPGSPDSAYPAGERAAYETVLKRLDRALARGSFSLTKAKRS